MKSLIEIAKEYIKAEYGSEFGIIEDSIIETDDLFCFVAQTLKYLESGNIFDMAIGGGYIFINKTDHRIFGYGSGMDFNTSIIDLRKSIKIEKKIRKYIPDFDQQKKYAISIVKVKNEEALIQILLQMDISYIIPEIVGTSIFRVSKPYKKKKIKERLINLPTTFNLVTISLNILYEFVKKDSCEFHLIEFEFPNRAKYVSEATAIDLEPIW